MKSLWYHVSPKEYLHFEKENDEFSISVNNITINEKYPITNS